MPLLADQVTELQAQNTKLQNMVDWVEGNNATYTVVGADGNGVSWTGAGADAYHAEWRSNNPSADSSSTSGVLENYNAWKNWSDNGSDLLGQEGTTDVDSQKAIISANNTEIARLQQLISDGFTGNETEEEWENKVKAL